MVFGGGGKWGGQRPWTGLTQGLGVVICLLPARASEQGNVIGSVSVYIYIYIYVIEKKL